MRSGSKRKEGRDMKNCMAMMAYLIPAALLAAGPAVKLDPVAEGYPDWQGLTAKNYIAGREISPSDLRHKVTIVIEIEPNEKLVEQLALAFKLAARASFSADFGANWEDLEMPRDLIAAFSVRGDNAKVRAEITEILTAKKKIADKETASWISRLGGPTGCPFYDDLTFTGAPDGTEKRPFVYVMGPTGKEPLFAGKLDAAGLKAANEAIAKGKKEIAGWDPKWRQFYGNIAEPKFNVTLAKVLEKGKTAKMAPLAPVSKALLTDVKSKDPERAKEAQILYDAIEQTRSDLVLRIQLEVGACPHRAYYDIETLIKYWPMEKKRLEAAYAKLKANPEIEPMGKMFCKLAEWSKPDFTCKNAGEAKKIVQELNKMKKALEKPKESKNITVQNGALLLDMKVDELIPLIPTKVAAK